MNGNGPDTERVSPLGHCGQFIKAGVQAAEIDPKVPQEGPVCTARELRLYQGSEDPPVLSCLPIPGKTKIHTRKKI